MFFFWVKNKGKRRKHRYMGLYQNLKLLCIKEHNQQREKETHRMEGNKFISGVSVWNIKGIFTTQ